MFAVDARGALTYRTVRHHFGDAVKGAGLSDVRLHDLRRTFMTNAAAAGVGTHVLRDLLGHKSTAMADRYVCSVGSPVADAREAVGSAMAAAMVGEGARDSLREIASGKVLRHLVGILPPDRHPEAEDVR